MFEDHPIFQIDTNVLGLILGFEKRIKPTLSYDKIIEINDLTKSVLDSTDKIDLGLRKGKFDLQEFDEVCKEFKDNDNQPEWFYVNEGGEELKNLYNAVAIHNTRYKINYNKSYHRKESIVDYLSGLSASCVLFLNKQRELLSTKNPAKKNVSFDPNIQQIDCNEPSYVVFSPSASDSSPESEKPKGGRS